MTFDSVAPSPSPRAADDTGNEPMSQTGYQAPAPGWLTGTAHANPLFDGKLQLNNLHDVGVVVLDEPYDGATPATLPPANYLDGLSRGNGGLNKQTFTLVGYGVFFEKPAEGPQKPSDVNDRTRRFTTAVGQNISSDTLKLAENAKDSRAGGGSCFGDSGGPAFHRPCSSPTRALAQASSAGARAGTTASTRQTHGRSSTTTSPSPNPRRSRSSEAARSGGPLPRVGRWPRRDVRPRERAPSGVAPPQTVERRDSAPAAPRFAR